jgi:hypothetical protein
VRRVALAAALLVAACGPKQIPTSAPQVGVTLPERIVAEFEQAVRGGPDAYAALFDFVAVGKYEKLLRRYDANGAVALTAAQKQEFLAEDATPFPEARERKNLGAFFPILAARTVGQGGCHARPPISAYGRALGHPFDPLPVEPASNLAYEPLRVEVNALVDKGGVVGIACDGGQGGLALVYTRSKDARGYALITMYDDVPETDASGAQEPASE